jgi:hypothetical protein
LAPERYRQLLVHVVKSPFVEQVGFHTVKTFGPISTAFFDTHANYFFIAKPRAVARSTYGCIAVGDAATRSVALGPALGNILLLPAFRGKWPPSLSVWIILCSFSVRIPGGVTEVSRVLPWFPALTL